MNYDVVIIGAGVSGSAIARELSRYDLNVCVLEKEEDVCSGTSKSNSAIVHAGFDAEEGSLMAKLNVRGNEMMEELSRDLSFPFRKNGAMVVCIHPEEQEGLNVLLSRGVKNGVKGLRILSRTEALELEPNLSDDVCAALYAPTSGIVCPFQLNIAMAENACENGVDFFFFQTVQMISRKKDLWLIETDKTSFSARCVINAAGVYADVFHNMVSEQKIHIRARRGDYCLLDKAVGDYVSHTIFPQPTRLGKGILVTPTVHGNLLLGPTAVDVDDKEGTNTTADGIRSLIDGAKKNVKGIPFNQVITSFSGLRAHEDHHEFVIGEVSDAPGFIDCAGIESPGLTASPAIGEVVRDIVFNQLKPKQKSDWNGTRKGILNPALLSLEERNALIKKQPAYGRIICRCESVTEGEILDAIRRPLGATSLDGIKRRTRAGAGRCQSGFCSPRVMEILHRERNLPYCEIRKNGANSCMVFQRTKEASHETN